MYAVYNLLGWRVGGGGGGGGRAWGLSGAGTRTCEREPENSLNSTHTIRLLPAESSSSHL